MRIRQWYLICLFVFVCVFLFVADGTDEVSAAVAAQPPVSPLNDNFADAALIDILPLNTQVDITGATLEPGEPQYCNYQSRTVWYRYQPTTNAVLQVNMDNSNFGDTALTVWQGTSLGDLFSISCLGWGGTIEFVASAGQTYYIQAGRQYDEAWGDLHLNIVQIPSPANDNFANATQVSGLPFSSSQQTRGSTAEVGEPTPSCAWNQSRKTVWYAYTPPANGWLYTYLDDYWNPGVLAVYTGSSLGGLTELGCRVYSTRLPFTVQANTTYYFQVANLYEYNQQITFYLDVSPPPQANLYYNPSTPSSFDTIQFSDNSTDPAGGSIQSQSWNFGDGSSATGCCPTHRYAADGSYFVTLTVTTSDGRTGSTIQEVIVKTHDVAITKFTAPNAASAGQTRSVVVGINSRRYDETVEVRLYKSSPGEPSNPWILVGTLNQFVPIRSSNRTTDFNFSYTFTRDDARIGKVTFKAVAAILTGPDALPADNEALSLPTKVGGTSRTSDDSESDSAEQSMKIFLPVVTKE